MDSLITALKNGDKNALATVFEQHANKIYRLALGILHDEQQADGVVQNTFVALIKHIDTFEGRSDIGTWLYRVAYNEAIGRIRKAKHIDDRDITDDENVVPACFIAWDTIPDQLLNDSEAAEQISNAVKTLSPALQAVFTLRDVEGVSTRYTAEILGISEAAVKVRLHRARLTLRERLATYFEEYINNEANV